MTIAIPVSQSRISPVLDSATRVLLVTRRRGREVARNEATVPPLSTESLAACLAELRADVLLCAALSEPLRRALERLGVQVRPHLCGEVEAILHAFDCGQLRRNEFRMPGCGCSHKENWCCEGPSAKGGKSVKGWKPKEPPRAEIGGPLR